jgi:hypothetical protein
MAIRNLVTLVIMTASVIALSSCGNNLGSQTVVGLGASLSSPTASTDTQKLPPSPSSVSTPAAPRAAHKSPPLPSPNLQITITPTSGPAGTTVDILVAGCMDASGENHAVSFNIGGHDPSAIHNPNNVVWIPSQLIGTTLTASYTIKGVDTRFGGGTFYVQCGTTVKTAWFPAVK